jgi:hypothetical protein
VTEILAMVALEVVIALVQVGIVALAHHFLTSSTGTAAPV